MKHTQRGMLGWAAGLMVGLAVPVASGQTEGAAQPAAAEAATLELGAKAPNLEIQEWIKGESFVTFEEGKVYVLDFWATWCLPCLASIPHLNATQARYADQGVVVLGISSPDARNTLEATKKMVADGASVRGATHKMAYSVAFAKGRGTWDAYARTGWDESIPHVFIVDRKGRLAWHGHPGEMDQPLAAIVAGTYDVEAAAKEARRRAELERLAQPLITQATNALRAGDDETALRLIGEVTAMDYRIFSNMSTWRYNKLIEVGRTDEAKAFGTALIEQHWTEKRDADLHIVFARRLIASGAGAKDLALALRAAERGVELSGGRPDALVTLARVHFERGDVARAIETQQKAIDAAPETDRAQLTEILESYRKEAGQG